MSKEDEANYLQCFQQCHIISKFRIRFKGGYLKMRR
jgi:hypothetical protein